MVWNWEGGREGGYSNSQQMLSKWPQGGSRDKCSSLQCWLQPSGPVTSRNQLHVYDSTAGDQLILNGFTYSQVPFTASSLQMKKDTLWQPLLYQHREILKLNTWYRSVCQGYHCSSCWLNSSYDSHYHFQTKFTIHSCKDALTDGLGTLPNGILLTVQWAKPHPRWSDFSGTKLSGHCPVTLFVWET